MDIDLLLCSGRANCPISRSFLTMLLYETAPNGYGCMVQIGHFRPLTGNASYHASRAAFAGFLISATANFALIYMLGLQPEEI